MDEQPIAPSGGDAPEVSDQGASAKSDVVAYETHKKLLSEKKRRDEEVTTLKSQLEQLLSKDKEREENELKAKEDYQKLLELRTKELEATRSELGQTRSQVENAKKLEAFLSALDGKVDRKYWGFVPLESLTIDPATGEVDELSLKKQVEDFRKQYTEIIKPKSPGGNPLPTSAPRGLDPQLSRSEKALKLGALILGR